VALPPGGVKLIAMEVGGPTIGVNPDVLIVIAVADEPTGTDVGETLVKVAT
jgi:hypothetical protein